MSIRRYKVTLALTRLIEIEVTASDVHEAQMIAKASIVHEADDELDVRVVEDETEKVGEPRPTRYYDDEQP